MDCLENRIGKLLIAWEDRGRFESVQHDGVREPIVQMLQRFFWSVLWLKSLPDLCSTCCIQCGESGSAMKRPRARNRGQKAVLASFFNWKVRVRATFNPATNPNVKVDDNARPSLFQHTGFKEVLCCPLLMEKDNPFAPAPMKPTFIVMHEWLSWVLSQDQALVFGPVSLCKQPCTSAQRRSPSSLNCRWRHWKAARSHSVTVDMVIGKLVCEPLKVRREDKSKRDEKGKERKGKERRTKKWNIPDTHERNGCEVPGCISRRESLTERENMESPALSCWAGQVCGKWAGQWDLETWNENLQLLNDSLKNMSRKRKIKIKY